MFYFRSGKGDFGFEEFDSGGTNFLLRESVLLGQGISLFDLSLSKIDDLFPLSNNDWIGRFYSRQRILR